jgi:hypothetical protein
MLKSDSAYFLDWFVFGVAVWLSAGLLITAIFKFNRTKMARHVIICALLTTLLPTQFPVLWRAMYGSPTINADPHVVELTQQVAVGALVAAALLLYFAAYSLAVLVERAVRYGLARGLFRHGPDLPTLHEPMDAVE